MLWEKNFTQLRALGPVTDPCQEDTSAAVTRMLWEQLTLWIGFQVHPVRPNSSLRLRKWSEPGEIGHGLGETLLLFCRQSIAIGSFLITYCCSLGNACLSGHQTNSQWGELTLTPTIGQCAERETSEHSVLNGMH